MFLVLLTVLVSVQADYWDERNRFLRKEENRAVGSNLVLSEREREANNIVMGFKLKEYDFGFVNPGNFSPARHFFHARKDIEKSEVFKIMQMVPKGASLHSHDTALASFDYVYNLTFRENLYGCTENGRAKLHFFKQPDQSCDWKLVSELRKSNSSYDSWLKSQLTLVVDNPEVVYPNLNVVWSTFMDIFGTVVPMITYKPIFKEYFYQVLKEFYEDNVWYLEFRGYLPSVYDINGHVFDPIEVCGFYKETADQFKRDYPNFIGAKLIFAPARKVDNKTMEYYRILVNKLKIKFPDFVAGFDLVGQEDLGYPLESFIDELRLIGKDMKLFFHAGETNWYGTSTDINLIDAILLNAKRIGHGFALVKHPKAMAVVKKNKIGIEISPISNQVLMLVNDIRNHPGSILIANGMPVIICNDDPGFWKAKGLSYDWYMAFMGMASRNADLRFLKQIAINSLIYSSMSSDQINSAFIKWEKQWTLFINKIISKYSHGVLQNQIN